MYSEYRGLQAYPVPRLTDTANERALKTIFQVAPLHLAGDDAIGARVEYNKNSNVATTNYPGFKLRISGRKEVLHCCTTCPQSE